MEVNHRMEVGQGKLFICATPIGNLNDVSFRLLETLKTVDLIISEDTRTIKKLLSKFKINYQNSCIESYHDNSGEQKEKQIIEKLKSGLNVALVSESGMPLISDPGYRIVRKCIDEGISITVIPGPNAALCALVASGLAVDNFLFIGFLPKSEEKLKNKLKDLKNIPFTMIFYESPNRIKRLLGIILEIFGDRDACVAREITKVYEEYIRGKVTYILNELDNREKAGNKLKGEVVLVLDGLKGLKKKDFSEGEIKEKLEELLEKKVTRKEAFKNILLKYEIDRKNLYDIYIKIKKS